MSELSEEHCRPITAASKALTEPEADALLANLSGWEMRMVNEPRIEKMFKFNGFDQAMDFTNKVARLAKDEDHHPAILTEYGKVTLAWWTHKVKGLHRNDFVMAARSDALYSPPRES